GCHKSLMDRAGLHRWAAAWVLAATLCAVTSEAHAQCATTQPGGAGTPVDYTCANNTTTLSPGTNTTPNNPSTTDFAQEFATTINGQVNSGVTVSGAGIVLDTLS